MRIADLVNIDSRFEKSINLLLDLNDSKKCSCYIPTRSSVRILSDYLQQIREQGERANILIGPYGKGKSHLLLVLMALLSGNITEEVKDLLERIQDIEPDLYENIRIISENAKFLPVIINVNSGNLSQAFVRSLNYALKRDGLTDIVPDNYFSEAVKTIRQWQNVFPRTFFALDDILEGNVEQFVSKLEAFDYDTLDKFRTIHPQLTSGSEFNPVIDDEAISIYRSVNRNLCEKHGYTGIYIIFDEFSKYVEGHSEEGFSADMKVLQDICELCNSSKEEQIHITCVAHKAIRSYGDSLSKEIRNAFRGVEGRLNEIMFTVSSQNNYELISDAIKKSEQFNEWKDNDVFKIMTEESFRISDFSSLFEHSDFKSIVAEGCYPLTPLSALLLMNLSEKIAQNERTIFTFLTGKDLHSLRSVIEKENDEFFVGAEYIYDYFVPLFEAEKNSHIHEEWLKADYALGKTNDKTEISIIKSLAVIRMINRPDDIPANDSFLSLACGLSFDLVKIALKGLISKSIVTYKKNIAAYDFQNAISVNLDNAIADCILKFYKNIEITDILNEICTNKYILPKKYNQDYFMTRYYRMLFMKHEAFLALTSSTYLSDKNQPDGFLIVTCEEDTQHEKSISHIEELSDKSLLLCHANGAQECEESARTLMAVKRLLADESFMKENEVAYTELKNMEEMLIDELNQWIEDVLVSQTEIYFCNKKISVDEYGINRAVSCVCEIVFPNSPIINHELINRHNISAQISKARNILLEDMLHGRRFEKYESGTSAEATIYRAVIMHTEDDENLLLIKNEIIQFIHECKGRKVSFSKLIKKLTASPFGMRKGVLPLYIVQQLMELEDMPVIYLNKTELSIDSVSISNAIYDPENYFLFIEEETGEKLEYIEGIEKEFAEYDSYCREIDNRNRLSRISCVIQSWYRSLPQTSRVFTVADYEDQDIRKIIAFRKLFRDDPNPREVIFDKIPTILGGQNLAETLEILKKTKKAIDKHITELKCKAVSIIRECLNLSETDDLKLSLLQWYEEQPVYVKNVVFSADSQRVLNCIKNLTVTDAEAIAEKISKETTGFYIEDWSDSSLGILKDCLNNVIVEIKNKKENADSARKITISGEEGEKDIVYDFNPDNISPSGYFLQNQIDDILEEFGDAVDNNEKIGILMATIKKLMGESI